LIKKVEARREAERNIELLVRALTAPIILHKCSWMEDKPKWILDYVKIDRLVALMEGKYNGMATDAEALAYLMPAALEAPLGYHWSRIYLYLGTKVIRETKKTELPKEVIIEDLDETERKMLDDLKRWVWEQQEKELKRRAKNGKRDKALQG